jgi:hypothetical protein
MAGGGLGWKNNITVVAGSSYTVVVAAGSGLWSDGPGNDSYFINTTTVKGGGGGGTNYQPGGTYVGDGGGQGGASSEPGHGYAIGGGGGGGGAGGYVGSGGNGGYPTSSAAYPGSGGGGGGDGDVNSDGHLYSTGGGGGVGIYGKGNDGTASSGNGSTNIGDGTSYGGGSSQFYNGAWGSGGGAVRIIWGAGRSFPSTLTTNQSNVTNGDLRFNSGTIASVTAMYIANINVTGTDISSFISTWGDSTSAIKGQLVINNGLTGSLLCIFNITSISAASGYYILTVSYSSGSLPTNNLSLSINYTRTGNAGYSGLRYNFLTTTTTPLPIGQQAYTTSGTYSWIAPSVVTSINVVAVGGGGSGNVGAGSGGGGGGLGYKNNITVVPGTTYTVIVGAGGAENTTGSVNPGGDSYFISTATVKGGGGGGGISGGSGAAGGAGGT